jgi:hypothetical protein
MIAIPKAIYKFVSKSFITQKLIWNLISLMFNEFATLFNKIEAKSF